mgnify:CR=1 FL=1
MEVSVHARDTAPRGAADAFMGLAEIGVRPDGKGKVREILDLAGRLPKGRASELWNRCMDFRFGHEEFVKGNYGYRLPT